MIEDKNDFEKVVDFGNLYQASTPLPYSPSLDAWVDQYGFGNSVFLWDIS